MPMRAMSMCSAAGCSELIPLPGRCKRHQPRRPWPTERPTYRERNGRLPESMRQRVLAEEPECRRCGSRSAPQVDHVDSTLTGEARNSRANLQRLCSDCNQKKSRGERYGFLVSR